jgi:hypothetical protein
MQVAEIRLHDIPPEGLQLAALICKAFDLRFGTLLRRSFAIQLADGQQSGILLPEHLQEAARHLVARTE